MHFANNFVKLLQLYPRQPCKNFTFITQFLETHHVISQDIFVEFRTFLPLLLSPYHFFNRYIKFSWMFCVFILIFEIVGCESYYNRWKLLWCQFVCNNKYFVCFHFCCDGIMYYRSCFIFYKHIHDLFVLAECIKSKEQLCAMLVVFIDC